MIHLWLWAYIEANRTSNKKASRRKKNGKCAEKNRKFKAMIFKLWSNSFTRKTRRKKTFYWICWMIKVMLLLAATTNEKFANRKQFICMHWIRFMSCIDNSVENVRRLLLYTMWIARNFAWMRWQWCKTCDRIRIHLSLRIRKPNLFEKRVATERLFERSLNGTLGEKKTWASFCGK